MIKITSNCDDFLQAYASANSGDSSGSSRPQERLSIEKGKENKSLINQSNNSNHVRFNSLVEISNKFKTHTKLKFK
jgi:hypothetical protein